MQVIIRPGFYRFTPLARPCAPACRGGSFLARSRHTSAAGYAPLKWGLAPEWAMMMRVSINGPCHEGRRAAKKKAAAAGPRLLSVVGGRKHRSAFRARDVIEQLRLSSLFLLAAAFVFVRGAMAGTRTLRARAQAPYEGAFGVGSVRVREPPAGRCAREVDQWKPGG